MDVGPLVAEMSRDARTDIRAGECGIQIQRVGIELGKVRILCRNFRAAEQRQQQEPHNADDLFHILCFILIRCVLLKFSQYILKVAKLRIIMDFTQFFLKSYQHFFIFAILLPHCHIPLERLLNKCFSVLW